MGNACALGNRGCSFGGCSPRWSGKGGGGGGSLESVHLSTAESTFRDFSKYPCTCPWSPFCDLCRFRVPPGWSRQPLSPEHVLPSSQCLDSSEVCICGCTTSIFKALEGPCQKLSSTQECTTGTHLATEAT